LRTYFHTEDGVVKAVDGVDFHVKAGETFAIVGESGCGKSVTAFSIMRLIPSPPGKIESGRIELYGRNLLSLNEKQMRNVRGGKIGMIFQEPMTSLNPVFTCGSQITEAIRLHEKISTGHARTRAIQLLEDVGIPMPATRFKSYPHQLSGGMRQRVMIAMALSCDPDLLIADEPTTALDVTIQAQILKLIADIQKSRNLGVILITHDLAVVAETADRVAVMYASKIVEMTDVYTLFDKPFHPYTRGLFKSIPKLGDRKSRLETIEGVVPNPTDYPEGCNFCERCPLVDEKCREQEPRLIEVEPGHRVACWKAGER